MIDDARRYVEQGFHVIPCRGKVPLVPWKTYQTEPAGLDQIDAWWTEPLPPESEWWRLPNVIATPHASHSSPRVRERTLALFLENLRRWKAKEPLLNVVDLRAGY